MTTENNKKEETTEEKKVNPLEEMLKDLLSGKLAEMIENQPEVHPEAKMILTYTPEHTIVEINMMHTTQVLEELTYLCMQTLHRIKVPYQVFMQGMQMTAPLIEMQLAMDDHKCENCGECDCKDQKPE